MFRQLSATSFHGKMSCKAHPELVFPAPKLPSFAIHSWESDCTISDGFADEKRRTAAAMTKGSEKESVIFSPASDT
jgi:hypothetical protein